MLNRLEVWVADTASAMAARVKRLLENVESHARVRMVLFILLLLLIGGIMLLLNMHTPLMMDDYDYSFSWATGERIGGVTDVLASQAAHYRLWGGRSVVHALAQFFLSMDKRVFNAANTLMYLLLLLEIYALARPKSRKWCWEILLLAHAFLFTGVPFFGTVFLWLTGACNYLWGTALALTPLLILRSAQEDGFFARGWHGWLAVPIFLMAGWTNENTACGILVTTLLLLAIQKSRSIRIRAWQCAAFAAEVAGVAVMLLAPGNFARASSYDGGHPVIELAKRAGLATAYGGVYLGVLLAGILLLWSLCSALGVKRRSLWTAILLFGSMASAYAMVASPVFSDRSWTGAIVLTMCAVLVLLSDIVSQVRAFDAAKLLILPLALLLLAYSGYKALSDVKAHEKAWLSQVTAIETAAAAGEESVSVSSVPSISRYTMSIIVEENPSSWPNSTLSRAFGIRVSGR